MGMKESRDIMHKNIYNSFVLGSMVMKFGKDMFNFMTNIIFKGFDDWRKGSYGTCMPIGNNAAARMQEQQA